MSHSAEKCKRGLFESTLLDLLTYILLQNIKKTRRAFLLKTKQLKARESVEG